MSSSSLFCRPVRSTEVRVNRATRPSAAAVVKTDCTWWLFVLNDACGICQDSRFHSPPAMYAATTGLGSSLFTPVEFESTALSSFCSAKFDFLMVIVRFRIRYRPLVHSFEAVSHSQFAACDYSRTCQSHPSPAL